MSFVDILHFPFSAVCHSPDRRRAWLCFPTSGTNGTISMKPMKSDHVIQIYIAEQYNL